MAGWADTRSYARLGALLVAASAVPAGVAALSLVIPQATLRSMPEWVGMTVILVGLLSPMPILFMAARSAVKSGIPGSAVLAGWWAVNVLLSLLNWGSPRMLDGAVWAMTLGVIAPSRNAAWGMPRFMVDLGSSPTFSVGIPFYALFLMASFSVVATRIKRARTVARLNAPWDESGERVEPTAQL